jgi:hypothetical protein
VVVVVVVVGSGVVVVGVDSGHVLQHNLVGG